MGEQEFIFHAKEMRIVEVICSNCGAGVSFDAANEKQHPPSRCASCATDDPQMFSALTAYRRWYQAIEKDNGRFRFRVPE